MEWELVLAISLCLFLLAIIVAGNIYLEMDKHKARAIVYVKKMTPQLDQWVQDTLDAADFSKNNKASVEELHTLARDYYACKKTKQMLKKISLTNAIVLTAAFLDDEALGLEADRYLNARMTDAEKLDILRSEYNKSAAKLNKRLQRRLSAAVAKIFRMKGIEPLLDLSSIS